MAKIGKFAVSVEDVFSELTNKDIEKVSKTLEFMDIGGMVMDKIAKAHSKISTKLAIHTRFDIGRKEILHHSTRRVDPKILKDMARIEDI